MEARPELTLICMDTSEWFKSTRSTRFKEQADGIKLYAANKLNSHPESKVGVSASSAGYLVEVIKPCRDLKLIMENIYRVTIQSLLDFEGAITLTPLHYKNDPPMPIRVAAFVAGDLHFVTAKMEKWGKCLKRDNIALDVVKFGKLTKRNWLLLKTLVDAADNNGNSHIFYVPRGSSVSEVLSKYFGESSSAPLGNLPMREGSTLLTLSEKADGEDLKQITEKADGENLKQITELIANNDALTEKIKNLKLELESFRDRNNQVAC